MKSASSSLRTSSAMALSFSWAKTLFVYRTGGKDKHTLSLWTMVFQLILSMYSWFQAKTSRLVFMKRASSLRTEASAYVPIRVIWLGMLSSKEISFRSSVGSTITLLLYYNAWRSLPGIHKRPFGPFMLLLSHTPSKTLPASGMWTWLLSMH